MPSHLPHFGVVLDNLLRCVFLDEAGTGLLHVRGPLSERTTRAIASGEPAKAVTWQEQATALAKALIASGMFGLEAEDEGRLIKVFKGYHESYERLKEACNELGYDSKAIQRGVLRIAFLDMAVRYCGMRLLKELPISTDVPAWLDEDGANKFWRQTIETVFPGLPLYGSTKRDADCCSRLQLNESKMKRCCYENEFPGIRVLNRLFEKRSEFEAALRHYGAFKLMQTLSGMFGRQEVNFWAGKSTLFAAWLSEALAPIFARLEPARKKQFCKAMIFEGASHPLMRKFFKDQISGEIPQAYRHELLAIANGDVLAVISEYVEFCRFHENNPPPFSWEYAFHLHRADQEHFGKHGVFSDGSMASSKLIRVQQLEKARTNRDFASQEQILLELLKLEPSNVDTHQMLGQLYDEIGRVEDAWEQFTTANKKNPSFVLAAFSLADSKSRHGFHEEALQILEQTTGSLGPGSKAHLKGLCLIRAGRLQEAIACLQEAFDHGWSTGMTSALLACAYHEMAKQNRVAGRAAKIWEKKAIHHGIRLQDGWRIITGSKTDGKR